MLAFINKEEFFKELKLTEKLDELTVEMIKKSLIYATSKAQDQNELYSFVNELLNDSIERKIFDKHFKEKQIVTLKLTDEGLELYSNRLKMIGKISDYTDVYNGFKWLFDFICNAIQVYSVNTLDEIQKFSNCTLEISDAENKIDESNQINTIKTGRLIKHVFKNGLVFESYYGLTCDNNISLQDALIFMSENLETIEMSYTEE